MGVCVFCSIPWRPFIELADVIALQRELVLRALVRPPTRKSDWPTEESGTEARGRACHARPGHDLVYRDLTLFEGLSCMNITPVLDRTAGGAASAADDVPTAGFSPTRVTNWLEQGPHG